MHRKKLLDKLENYAASQHITKEELPFIEQFVDFIQANPTCFERSNKGHITGSCWIVNHDKSQALLTHHKKLNKWLQLGGHADGDTDIKAVAFKEEHEESGIREFELLIPGIFDIDIHPIPGPCAYHYDIRFLFQAAQGAAYKVSDESHDLSWIAHDELAVYSQERSVLRMAAKVSDFH